MGNGAYKRGFQFDSDVSTPRYRTSRLHHTVSNTVFTITTVSQSLPQENVRAARWKERRYHIHIVLWDTHVEVSLDKRFQADRNVHDRNHRRVFIGRSCIMENGKVIEIAEIPARW